MLAFRPQLGLGAIVLEVPWARVLVGGLGALLSALGVRGLTRPAATLAQARDPARRARLRQLGFGLMLAG